jgi:DNA-binding transcriptional MerR regulator
MKSGLTVGQFAQMTHLSVKALRHYHDVGVLIPTTIDPDTGYRYYRLDQVPSAQVIRRLRDLDMPVADVKAVLAAADTTQRNALISAHLRRLEDRLDQTHRVVSSLRALLDPLTPDTAIEHRTVPATPAIGIQETVERGGAEIKRWAEKSGSGCPPCTCGRHRTAGCRTASCVDLPTPSHGAPRWQDRAVRFRARSRTECEVVPSSVELR